MGREMWTNKIATYINLTGAEHLILIVHAVSHYHLYDDCVCAQSRNRSSYYHLWFARRCQLLSVLGRSSSHYKRRDWTWLEERKSISM